MQFVRPGQKSSEETLPFLNIEDPIELHRNLNFALTEDTALEAWAACWWSYGIVALDPTKHS